MLSHSDGTFLILSHAWSYLPTPGNGNTEFFCSKAAYDKINENELNENELNKYDGEEVLRYYIHFILPF
jgi:hypothetical protein